MGYLATRQPLGASSASSPASWPVGSRSFPWRHDKPYTAYVSSHKGRAFQKIITTMKAAEIGQPLVRRVLGENMVSLMRHHGQANRRLAEKVGIGEGTIQRAKRGTASLTIDNLAAIAEVFGLQAWQMLTPDLDPNNPPQLTFPSQEERELYERFRNFLKK